jgi:Na+/H+-dicarboxylate symporter
LLTWLAALFSSTFLTILFGLPLVGGGIDLSFSYIMDVINHIPFLSPFLISIYLTLVFIVISLFNDRLHNLLERGYSTLEKVFDYFDIVNPVIMFLAGGFLLRIQLPAIAQLPENLPFVSNVNALTFYIYGAVLSAVIGFGFLLLLIITIRIWIGKFNFNSFYKYLSDVSLFAFLTSSEIATIPINMRAVGDNFGVEKNVRNTVIPIIGTLQSTEIAIVLPIFAVLASFAVGVEISFVSLLIYSCTIFIIYDFVVVGVPSEVAILAVPLSQLLPIPDLKVQAFIGIIIALQAGLSDSIRTVVNVAFGGLFAILMEKVYHKL